MIAVGIVGASGYTGEELIRVLQSHPQVELTTLTSTSHAGESVSSVLGLNFPFEHTFQEPTVENLSNCELVFFATPNGIAMEMAPDLIEKNIRLIDISADFRIKDISTWEKWYGCKHLSPHLVEESVYGLPEIHGQKDKIAKARIVGNPGCYPTATLLSLIPLRDNLPKQQVLVDAKSGISGAGRNPDSTKLFTEGVDNFQAYAVKKHRHYPEILGILESVNTDLDILFVPHLSSMTRGIYSSIYLQTKFENVDQVTAIYRDYYKECPFVSVVDESVFPKISDVENTNKCHISPKYIEDQDGKINLVVFCVIDNLIKGASGQAVQNMNIMFNLDEKTGLI